LILPALQYAHQDHTAGQLDDDDLRWIEEAMHGIVEELGEWRDEQLKTQRQSTTSEVTSESGQVPVAVDASMQPRIVGIAARTEIEELAVAAVFEGLRSDDCRCDVISTDLLTSERIEKIVADEPLAVCISTFPPGDVAATRQLCKRLRMKLPNAKIYIGRWSGASNVHRNEQLAQAGATKVVESATELDKLLRSAVQLHKLSDAPKSTAASKAGSAA
jgi:hypothetical protein